MPRSYGSPSKQLIAALYAKGGPMSRRELRQVLSRAGECNWNTPQGIRRMCGAVRVLLLNGSVFMHGPRGDLELTELGVETARKSQPLRRKAM